MVVQFGLWVENRLSIRDKKGNPKYTLEKLLLEDSQMDRQRFGSLAGFVTKKIAIPESGVWDAS